MLKHLISKLRLLTFDRLSILKGGGSLSVSAKMIWNVAPSSTTSTLRNMNEDIFVDLQKNVKFVIL